MKNCLEISDKLIQDIMKNPLEKRNPRLDLVIQENSREESYSIHYAAKSLIVKAESPQAAVFAVNQQEIVGGYWGDFLGSHSPRFPLRIIWLEGNETFLLSDQLSLSVPSIVNETVEAWQHLASRIVELGFNGLVIGAKNIPEKESTATRIADFCATLRSYGIKIIVKPNYRQSIDRENPQLNELFDLVGNFDYLFWERGAASIRRIGFDRYTETERISREIHFLERYLPKGTSLIFYLPSVDQQQTANQALKMNKLLDEMHKGSLLAFSTKAGDFEWDHLPAHPFWDLLRQSPDVSGTGLLPIINTGSVNQGEALWPSLSIDLTEQYLGKCKRHCFAGALCYTRAVPRKGELLECNFWVTGQLLWRELPADYLMEMWLKCRHPEMNKDLWLQVFEISRRMVLELSLLRYLVKQKNGKKEVFEEGKFIAETIANYLNRLQGCEAQLKGDSIHLLNRLREDAKSILKQVNLRTS